MSHVVDGPVGGAVGHIRKGGFMFIGIREELVGMLMDQNLDEVLTYAFTPGSLKKTVECVFPPARARALRLPATVSGQTPDTYVRLKLTGELHYSAGGLIFGKLQ